MRPLDWTLRVVSDWVTPIRSRWHPSRLWIGYASNAGRFVMPLAKFFYGKTHKYYFRSAAAVIVASYVTAVAAHFDAKHRWILYLIAFGVVTAVYWLAYAPAKWIHENNLQSESDYINRNNRTSLMSHQDGGEYQYADELLQGDMQELLHNGTVPDQPHVPVEARVLHFYLLDSGRWSKRGQYGHTRQWKPPGFWHGQKEYRTFRDAVSSEVADSKIAFLPVPRRGSSHAEQKMAQLRELAKAVLHLDDHSRNWRKRAQKWDDGGRVRIVLQRTRALVSQTLGRNTRDS